MYRNVPVSTIADKIAAQNAKTRSDIGWRQRLTELAQRQQSLYNSQAAGAWVGLAWDVNNLLFPGSYRYFVQNRDKGYYQNQSIYDARPTLSLNRMATGLYAGMSDPSRPWFALKTGDDELNESPAVRDWLSAATKILERHLLESNLYNILPAAYLYLSAYGTCAGGINETVKGLSFIHFPYGEYWICQDGNGEVNGLMRRFQKPAWELVSRFGKDQVSDATRRLFDGQGKDTWVDVCHSVLPNERYFDTSNPIEKEWESVYWEWGREQDGPLSVSGFDHFPSFACRWSLAGSDIWGKSPAYDMMPGIKSLQQMKWDILTAGAKKSNPSLFVPGSMRNQEINLGPGMVTFGAGTPDESITPLYKGVNFDTSDIKEMYELEAETISKGFYNDLFLAISSVDKDMTAFETAQRHTEALLQLGPALWRVSEEMLKPLVETSFYCVAKHGGLPPAPVELQGADLQVKFVPLLIQALGMVDVNAADQFVMRLGEVAKLKPEVLDTFDADEYALRVSDGLGVDPKLVISGKQLALIRQQKQIQAQKMQQSALLNQNADTYQKIGNIPVGDSNVATLAAQRMGLGDGHA
jgi:Bacteriophage head to tail connecting protein